MHTASGAHRTGKAVSGWGLDNLLRIPYFDKALTPAAIGLMTTGNTGIFRDLTRSGPGISQLYNLTVAYLGAKNYNTPRLPRASRGRPLPYVALAE